MLAVTDNSSEPAIALTVDARGLACPLPVLKLRKALSGLASGAVVELLATDRAAVRDVPTFCTGAGHAVVSSADDKTGLRFVVRRG
jgi:tRNA 2-thiouridine synthesizing protein A